MPVDDTRKRPSVTTLIHVTGKQERDAPTLGPHASRVGRLQRIGVPSSELRRQPWSHPFHGVARLTGAPDDDPITRIRDAAALLSGDGAVSGWAAAYVHGVRYLDGCDRSGRLRPVLLHSGSGSQLRRRQGIEPSRARVARDEIVEVDGVPCTVLHRAIYDEMLRARHVVEAVVILEMGVTTVLGPQRATVQAVAGHVTPRGRNIRRVRVALGFGGTRSASPWETRLRMTAVLELGMAGLLVNCPVFSLSGDLLGVADLLDPDTGLVLEADGGQHLETSHRGDDNRRNDVMHDHNLTVVRVTQSDFQLRQVARRIAQGDRRARARHRSKDRWTLQKPTWWLGHPLAQRWG